MRTRRRSNGGALAVCALFAAFSASPALAGGAPIVQPEDLAAPWRPDANPCGPGSWLGALFPRCVPNPAAAAAAARLAAMQAATAARAASRPAPMPKVGFETALHASTHTPSPKPDPAFPFNPGSYPLHKAGWGQCGPCFVGPGGWVYILPLELQTGGRMWHPSHPPQSGIVPYVNNHPEDGPPGLFGVP
jgi:hypothetical protein